MNKDIRLSPELGGLLAVVIAIGEIRIAGVAVCSVDAMPAVQRTAPVREPVAGASACHAGCIPAIHPSVNAVIPCATSSARRQADVGVRVPFQAPARRAFPASNVKAMHCLIVVAGLHALDVDTSSIACFTRASRRLERANDFGALDCAIEIADHA
ncbi:hypothetical protein [Burkholderia perseverans]|uniref:hypothetical protein n=1 Tax=Burkholderia perseverans TaxID=2615214 RepID=UPI001FEDCA30|nr:hypothetical protein [Burkholderia perseverans]